MAIYTKTGDKGNTKVLNKKSGKLIPTSKNSCQIRTIGAIDELNSFLGMIKLKEIPEIQRNLFTINSIIAGSKLRFTKVKTKKIEKTIDRWEGELPVLKNFIIYSGSTESTQLFYARALCRRAERSLVSHSKKESVNPSIMIYINRLSDYLFMLARWTNFKKGEKEEYWIGKKR